MDRLSEESLRTLCNMSGLSCKTNVGGHFKSKDKMIKDLKSSPKEIGAVIMTPYEGDDPVNLTSWGDEALSLLGEEIDYNVYSEGGKTLIYNGKVGNATENKLELVYVTEPNQFGNAVIFINDLYSEYAGDMPYLKYNIIM